MEPKKEKDIPPVENKVVIGALAAFFLIVIAVAVVPPLVKGRGGESETEAVEPEMIRVKCDPEDRDVDHFMCARCAMKKTERTEGCQQPTVELSQTLLSEKTAKEDSSPCKHEWIFTEGSGYVKSEGAHGHKWVRMDGRTVYLLSVDEEGVAGLLEYAASTRVESLDIWNRMIRYAATEDETYLQPFPRKDDANPKPSKEQVRGWLEVNMKRVDDRLSTWVDPGD